MLLDNILIDKSWENTFSKVSSRVNLDDIWNFITQEKAAGKIVYPSEEKYFNAFRKCSYKNLKVIILGQDPYHNPKQAHGLSFSVPAGKPTPPSLRNIYKELKSDLAIDNNGNTDLSPWAKQGVLLLNAILTVNANEPGSHKKSGWEQFTDQIILEISNEKEGLIFMLWGNYAQSKAALIDSEKHLVLTAAHPSPFSAHRGFFGCKHFSKTNIYLKKQNKDEINWSIQSQGLLPFH